MSKRIRKEQPLFLTTIKKALFDFTPRLIVNKAPSEKATLAPVQRIKAVSKRKLSIGVGYLGSLPFLNEIEKSACTLVPWASCRMNMVLKNTIKETLLQLEDIKLESPAA